MRGRPVLYIGRRRRRNQKINDILRVHGAVVYVILIKLFNEVEIIARELGV